MSVSVPDAVPPIYNSMCQLGPAIYLRDFPKPLEKNDNPLTIVLFFWMNASLRPAAKYISEYTKIAPNARIICVFTSASDLFLRTSDAAQRKRISPVLDAILSLKTTGRTSDGELYVHVFSNGGSLTLARVASAYRDATGNPLPIRALLVDSAPGKASLGRTVKALSYSFPKFFLWRIMLSGVVWTWVLMFMTVGKLLRKQSPSSRLRDGLNDPKLIAGRAERCYVYSKEDELIPWKDVEDHAERAHSKGWVVSREMFEASPHVGHMKTDPRRYWNIVARLLKVAAG